MPTLDKKLLNSFALDSFSIDKRKTDAFVLDGLGSGGGGGGGIDSYTKLMLHMNGADGSTTFTDSSASAHTVTAYGNAQIDTAQYKFGGASGLFDGTGDYIDMPDSEDWNVGAGDFTIDAWVRKGANGVTQYFFGQTDSADNAENGSLCMAFNSTDKLLVYAVSVSSQKVITSTTAITDTNWHHVAFVRDGNTLRLFIDGVANGTRDVTGITVNNSTYKVSIGRFGEYAGNTFNGQIDEFRFSKGIARWTENFTPPTSEYSA